MYSTSSVGKSRYYALFNDNATSLDLYIMRESSKSSMCYCDGSVQSADGSDGRSRWTSAEIGISSSA